MTAATENSEMIGYTRNLTVKRLTRRNRRKAALNGLIGYGHKRRLFIHIYENIRISDGGVADVDLYL